MVSVTKNLCIFGADGGLGAVPIILLLSRFCGALYMHFCVSGVCIFSVSPPIILDIFEFGIVFLA